MTEQIYTNTQNKIKLIKTFRGYNYEISVYDLDEKKLMGKLKELHKDIARYVEFEIQNITKPEPAKTSNSLASAKDFV